MQIVGNRFDLRPCVLDLPLELGLVSSRATSYSSLYAINLYKLRATVSAKRGRAAVDLGYEIQILLRVGGVLIGGQFGDAIERGAAACGPAPARISSTDFAS